MNPPADKNPYQPAQAPMNEAKETTHISVMMARALPAGSVLTIADPADAVSIDTFDQRAKTEAEQIATMLNGFLPRRTMEYLARELNSLISPGPKEKLVIRLPTGQDEEVLKEMRDGFSHRYQVLTIIDPTM